MQSCSASRPITIYRRGRAAPFPPGFVAMVPREAPPTLPWRCRQGFDCLVTCPFLANGDVTVSLSRMSGGGLLGGAESEEGEPGAVWRLGPYLHQARFRIRAFNRAFHAGTYLCRASTASRTVVSSVVVR